MLKIKFIFLSVLFLCIVTSYSQEEKKVPPAFDTNRSDENYAYLKDEETNPYKKGFADDLKFIPLTSSKSSYVSIGGQFRPRIEHFTNRNWIKGDEAYYSHRLSLHGDFHFGNTVRVFTELANGFKTGDPEFGQSDDLGIHQGFLEIKLPIGEKGNFNFRFGRQELNLGASRLVSDRTGPNIRRSFDVMLMGYTINSVKLTGYYGKEVTPNFFTFDNEFNFFNNTSTDPEVWSIGAGFPIKNLTGSNEVYYLGFKSKSSLFSDVFGEETRHTIGLRRYGAIGKRWTYNTELVYQFGAIASSSISAFNLETDWKYKLINTAWTPIIGLKFDWSSGDKQTGDGKLNTFNPLFVNPGLYSLAGINTPANLTSFHPSLTVLPFKRFSIYMDYAKFYRTSKNDGLYVPTRFQTREANGIKDRFIGDAFGLILTYEFNRNISFDIKSYYFIPGDFVELSGSSETIFHIAPTLDFRF